MRSLYFLFFIFLTYQNLRADLVEPEDISTQESPTNKSKEKSPDSISPPPFIEDLNPPPIFDDKPKKLNNPTTTTNPSSKKNSTKPPSQNKQDQEKIYFKSTGLRGNKKEGRVELEENVLVTQGELYISCDKAIVFYNTQTEEVEKIQSIGNVKIRNQDETSGQSIRAESKEAFYFAQERKITLKGKANLIKGESVVRGKEITYELDTGWIKADKVEGVMQPKDKDLDKNDDQK